jgi:mandelate racemase
MGEKITAVRWGSFCEALNIDAPLFRVPEVCTVHVRLDAGPLQGCGYAYCWHGGAAEALLRLGALFSAKLIGMDLADWSDVSAAIKREYVNFLGTQGMAAFVLSALDLAVWDLVLKTQGASLQTARNRPSGPAPCYASRDLWPSVDPLDCGRIAAGLIADGFRGVKMWVSNRDPRRERARVAAVREAIGPGNALYIDANQVFRPRQALEFAESVAEFTPEWLEDPVHKDDMTGLAWLTERSPVPIATGENAYGADGLKRVLDAAPIASALVDLQRIGGITGWLQAEALCAVYGVRCTTHVYHHVGARLLAGCQPKDGLVEYSNWFDGPFGAPEMQDGFIVPNAAPGATADPQAPIAWSVLER